MVIGDLSKEEMAAISQVIELWDAIYAVLGRVQARPKDGILHIESEIHPFYLGWVGWNEGGDITFQPAPPGTAGGPADPLVG
jgi:hypothetical protein